MFSDGYKKPEYMRLEYRSTLYIRIDGPLVTRGTSRARRLKPKIVNKIEKEIKTFGWKYAPRAKIAVSLSAYSNEKNHPDIHNLVKFYLDLLNKRVFYDDRQIHYLEASMGRVSRSDRGSSILIKVMRLKDKKRVHEVANSVSDHLDTDDEQRFQYDPLDEPIDINLIPKKARKGWALMLLMQQQQYIFSGFEIAMYDFPHKFWEIPTAIRMTKNIPLLTLDLGELSEVSGSDEFKLRLEGTLDNFVKANTLLSKIYIPIELNIEVTPKSLTLGKDVDNIAMQICPLIKEKLCKNNSYIHGYRIYVCDDPFHNDNPNALMQIHAEGAIHKYNDKVEKAFEVYGENLDD